MDAKSAPIGAWKTAQALFPTAPTAIIFILIKIHEKTGVRAERTDECRELISFRRPLTTNYRTLSRGQIGQKKRGFSVGEATFGYLSRDEGETYIDPHGRRRSQGKKMYIKPSEAAVVRRIFEEFAAGRSKKGVVALLNAEGVPAPKRCSAGWQVSTISRILNREKYIGTWSWNLSRSVREPLTGRRRQTAKPVSEHIVEVDERYRIVPPELWDAVQARQKASHKAWPKGKRRGFSSEQGSRTDLYPTHLFDGLLRCGKCGERVNLVSGKEDGYYGCSARRRHMCDNRVNVRRSVLERILLGGITGKLLEKGAVRYALGCVADEIRKLSSGVGEMVARKEAELGEARKRLDNLLKFVEDGQVSSSEAVLGRLSETETRVARLSVETEALRQPSGSVLPVPSEQSVVDWVARLQVLLERRTPESSRVLGRLLGRIVLDPVTPETGRPFYVARTAIDTFVLLEPPGPPERPGSGGGPDGGSPSLHWWRRRESNPRPRIRPHKTLHAYPRLLFHHPCESAAKTAGG